MLLIEETPSISSKRYRYSIGVVLLPHGGTPGCCARIDRRSVHRVASGLGSQFNRPRRRMLLLALFRFHVGGSINQDHAVECLENPPGGVLNPRESAVQAADSRGPPVGSIASRAILAVSKTYQLCPSHTKQRRYSENCSSKQPTAENQRACDR